MFYPEDTRDVGSICENSEERNSEERCDIIAADSSALLIPKSASSSCLVKIPSDVMINNLLPFLSSIDICRLSMTSSQLCLLCTSPNIWTELSRRDFQFSSLTYRFDIKLLNEKEEYIARVQSVANRIQEFRIQRELVISDSDLRAKKRWIFCCLDYMMVKCLVPMPIIALFLTIILTSLRLDNKIHISR